MDLSKILESAFLDLDAFLKATTWYGRENEIVNLYAHRFLHSRVNPTGALRSIRQVGIEVAVRQIRKTPKKYVRKDLVIWPDEDMTVWTENAQPIAIVEWKRNSVGHCRLNVEWLKDFLCSSPLTCCYVACANLVTPRGCHFLRVD